MINGRGLLGFPLLYFITLADLRTGLGREKGGSWW